MSGTRFARSGRCRLFICLVALMLMFGMVAIFHSSQQQLDETREQRLRCEQQQEALNIRLQSFVEQKFNLEKSQEREREEQMKSRKELEQQLESQKEIQANAQLEASERLEKLQQSFNALQSKHNQLIEDNIRTQKLHLEETKKLQLIRAELEKEKNVQDNDVLHWKEKYNNLVHEKERLDAIISANDPKFSQKRISILEHIVAEYKSNCEYKPKEYLLEGQQQINKPLNPPDTTRNSNAVRSGFDKPQNLKSFNEQTVVSPDLYKISNNLTNKTLNASNTTPLINVLKATNATGPGKNAILTASSATGVKNGDGVGHKILENQLNLPFSARNNRSLIINSVENFQIAPKPLKKVSEETPETQLKQEKEQQKDAGNANIASPLSAPLKQSTETKKAQGKNLIISSTSISPPLSMPLSQRRQLPVNVAPIPENFDDLLRNNENNPKANAEKFNNNVDPADIDAAAEELPKNENDNDNENNRYANAVNDLEQKAKVGAAANEDSGAHEIKDHDFINDQNFNLPADEDNFFGGANKHDAGLARDVKNHKAIGDNNDDDDDLLGNAGAVGIGGDIAVKNQNMLDADNLNNEVMRDQGKEFPADGLRLEDGNDEDEDEDDYSNPAARKKGGQAIRN